MSVLTDTIAKAAVERDDKWGHIVLSHFNTMTDLVAAEAKYYSKCYADFFRLSSERKAGHSQDCALAEAHEKYFS